eukprot:scaffold1642_cov252-Pinguiococcus_pyrenoidosus.AAC.12
MLAILFMSSDTCAAFSWHRYTRPQYKKSVVMLWCSSPKSLSSYGKSRSRRHAQTCAWVVKKTSAHLLQADE